MSLPGLTDQNPHPPLQYNNFVPPAGGGAYQDPVFGTTIRRLTADREFDDIYAKNGWWNADATKYVHGSRIINTANGQQTHTVNRGSITGDASMDPVDPNVYYYYSGTKIRKVVLNANGTVTESDFFTAPSTLQSLGTSVNWWSADGSLFLVCYGGAVRVIKKATMAAYTGTATAPSGGGWLGITPSGNHLVGYWGNNGRSWKLNHTTLAVASQVIFWEGLCGDHAVPITGSDGVDYCVVQDCNNHDEIWRVNVDNNAAGKGEDAQRAMPGNKLLTNLVPWQNEKHFSAVAKGTLKDWVFVSFECIDGCQDSFNANVPSSWPVLRQEIVGIHILTGAFQRVAHHRSRSINQDYGYQPRVSVSWSGERVGWASNMNQAGGSDIYAADFGASAVVPPVPVPIDCVWGPWTPWGPVPGDPTREQRTRVIATPAAHGGAPCTGPAIEYRPVTPVPPAGPTILAAGTYTDRGQGYSITVDNGVLTLVIR